MQSETVAKSRRQQGTETRRRNSDETNDANDGGQDATEPRNVNPTGSPAENYRFMVRNSSRTSRYESKAELQDIKRKHKDVDHVDQKN